MAGTKAKSISPRDVVVPKGLEELLFGIEKLKPRNFISGRDDKGHFFTMHYEQSAEKVLNEYCEQHRLGVVGVDNRLKMPEPSNIVAMLGAIGHKTGFAPLDTALADRLVRWFLHKVGPEALKADSVDAKDKRRFQRSVVKLLEVEEQDDQTNAGPDSAEYATLGEDGAEGDTANVAEDAGGAPGTVAQGTVSPGTAAQGTVEPGTVAPRDISATLDRSFGNNNSTSAIRTAPAYPAQVQPVITGTGSDDRVNDESEQSDGGRHSTNHKDALQHSKRTAMPGSFSSSHATINEPASQAAAKDTDEQAESHDPELRRFFQLGETLDQRFRLSSVKSALHECNAVMEKGSQDVQAGKAALFNLRAGLGEAIQAVRSELAKKEQNVKNLASEYAAHRARIQD
ncbi:Hypothetical predicted protein [Lecanosticta acicola]|uniref:Uncharacterized protein n=1 Tax=Lecanosticta acicola TaxID=111012 RepID=A0AAI9EFP7_9PEZI|nr:Hypothetical predicted protein [Lecanosticta acicola]